LGVGGRMTKDTELTTGGNKAKRKRDAPASPVDGKVGRREREGLKGKIQTLIWCQQTALT